jgi:hypothetical protein
LLRLACHPLDAVERAEHQRRASEERLIARQLHRARSGDDAFELGQYARRVHRRALGLLFAALAIGLGLIGVYSALAGGSAWVIALAAAALALWMADLARRALVRRRA